ncbi:MAG: 4-hydroxythreonine-4-phosphate dehydrogenase PdxA [Prevotellaceae bacterium]|jgi:4-hydroxythreonine-4-phosphate dehydrogenase|nr:4-hydroxythreonine-4-phosphate dehydrogenase PdxA [Prevotellaceae bacterium]
MEDFKIKVGITQGDINGIGYEVIIKTLADPRINDFCIPVIYGSSKVAAYHRKALNIENFSLNAVNSVSEINPRRSNIINCTDDEIKVELSKSTEEAGAAAFLALERATADLKDGLIDVLVTAPINKKNIQSDKFSFPGHTEYLEEKFGDGKKGLMLMVNDILKVAVVTGHLPLKDVASHITEERIISKLKELNLSLIRDFGVIKPRIAVLGLNPHSGDNGVLGTEEQEIIIPAIRKANDKGILCFGPYPADGFFGAGSFGYFDAVLAMYHDQGLAPFKAISMESGVNYTAGLPVIRTSPAHGTAYDKAGIGEASEESFRNALYLACDIFNNRKTYSEITKNPLKKQEVEISGIVE